MATEANGSSDGGITMYGADWCGDCRRAKAWFDEHEINFTYVDLIENPDEVERVLERNNGVQKIPVIVFEDDSHLVEPTNDELEAKMNSLRQSATPPVIENRELGRFELLRNGEVVSFATYTERDGTVIVPHIETAIEHRGNGYSSELLEGMLAMLRASDRTVTPICPVAAQYIRSNEQHHDLVAS